jgi:hypothetical protein
LALSVAVNFADRTHERSAARLREQPGVEAGVE